MKSIYLANNGGIYHFCKMPAIPVHPSKRRYVYRCYYIRKNYNYMCPFCFIEIPGLLITPVGERYNPLLETIVYYTCSGEGYIERNSFKKLYNPKQIWSVAQK